MTPRKRKRSKAVDSKASLPPKKPSGAKKKPVACSRCRSQKVKCEVPDGHVACSRCTASGPQVAGECNVTVLENHGSTHGSSAPLVGPPPANLAKPASQRPIPQHASTKKTSPSTNVADPPPPKRQRTQAGRATRSTPRKPAATSPLLTANLNDIPEIDEPYDIPEIDEFYDPPAFGEPTYHPIESLYYDTDVSTSQPHSLEHANAFFDAVTAGLPCDSDGYVSEKSETFDLDAVSESSDGDDVDNESKGSDDDSDLDMQLIAKRPNIKARGTTKPKAAAQPPKTSRSSGKTEPPYDPDNCLFTVQCIARQPNGSNAPFEILSTISLDELRSKVGRKMERFPDLIRLQYRLESDKAWQGATSVQNDEELDLFKAKMRAMIVPGRTKTGRTSNRILKNPTVHFTDASMDSSNDSARSKGGSKASGSSSGATKQKPSPSSSGQLEGASRREELIKQLQERWKCDIHAKGPESPVYCYVPDEKSEYCYPLTINNMSFWAIQIMDEKATVDTKPVGLPTQTARLRTRGSTVQPSSQTMGMPTQGPGMPGPQAPGYPGGYGYGYGLGYGAPPFFPWGMVPPGTQQPSRLPSPVPSNMSSAGHLHVGTSSNSRSRSVSPLPPASIPSITKWLAYLDQHAERSQDGVNYSQFEGILQEKGFTRLSQLASKHVVASDLQQWLGVTVGTAVNIKDYADDDLEAVKAGNLVIV